MDLSENSKRRIEASYKTWIDIAFNNKNNPFEDPCRLDESSSEYEMFDTHLVDEFSEALLYNEKLFRPKLSNEIEEEILRLTGHRYLNEFVVNRRTLETCFKLGVSVGIDCEPYREPVIFELLMRNIHANVNYFWKIYTESWGNPENERNYETVDTAKLKKFGLETREAYETRMLTDKRREN